jgi:transcriptional regulator with XRE-family HTH domain
MTGKQFKEWQVTMGWSAAEAARRLGKSPDTISKYRAKGVPQREALVVTLACKALEAGIKP